MATVTAAGTTFNTTAGNKTVVATPALGDLIVVVAPCTLAGGTTSVTDNNSGGAGTYVQVDQDRTGFSTNGVLTVWVRNALIASASSTTFTAVQSGSTGGGLCVLRIADMSIVGRDAVRRIGVASWNTGGQSAGGAGGTPAPVLAANPLTANVVILAVCNGTNSTTTVTQRASFTEHFDNGYTTPATGFECCSRNSGETAATQTFGSTTATAFASVAVELDTSVPQYDWVLRNRNPDAMRIMGVQGSVGRQSTW
jgi:hypothetical protein